MPFPLPLTPFERYYLADDRPEYPTTIPVELRFSGVLSREPFERALRQCVVRHPLLHALVEDSPSGPQWISAGDREPYVDFADDSTPIAPPDGEFIDLRRVPGLRAWVRTSQETSLLLMQVHHACCDGVAVLDFIGDLLTLYAAANGTTVTLPQLDAQRLRERAAVDVGDTKPGVLTGLRDVAVTAWFWSRIALRNCVALARPDRRGSRTSPRNSDHGFLTFEAHRLDRQRYAQLQAWARARGVGVNDVLLREMLLTVRQWNLEQGESGRGRVRISVPVYVRGRLGAGMPASNGIGYAFVALDPSKLADSAALLDAVHEEMDRIKRWKLALYFLGGLALASNFPAMVNRMLSRNKPFATVVLSNLSRVFAQVPLPRRDGRLECGNVVLESIEGVPPIRHLTRGSMVVLDYAGELSISLRCDPRDFTPTDTRALLDAFVERLEETIARGA